MPLVEATRVSREPMHSSSSLPRSRLACEPSSRKPQMSKTAPAMVAQRSASAAKEIKELIDASVQTVAGGGQLVSQAGNTMNDVVASVQRVSTVISEITTASREQSEGIDQINRAIAQMDESTQQNAALVEQAAAAAQSLQQQAERLAAAVSTFRV